MTLAFQRSGFAPVLVFPKKYLWRLRSAVNDLIGRQAAQLLTLLTCVLIGALLTSAPASAQTSVTGSISTATRWTQANGPYLISGNLVIENGAVLTIDPGVTIYMGRDASLTVQAGGIQALGLLSSPIKVLSDKTRIGQTAAAGDWLQWIFNAGTASTRLDHVLLEHGSGLAVNGSSPIFNYLNLRHHQGAAIKVDLSASPSGLGNQASDNGVNGVVVPAGDLSGSVKWNLLGIPYVLANGVVSVGISPTVSSITPNTLQQGETATVNIAGSRLSGLAGVRFDKPGLTAQVLPGATATQAGISVSAQSGIQIGWTKLSLLVDSGEINFPDAINILPTQPKLSSVTPSSIWSGQGKASVTIKGQNFTAQSVAYLGTELLATTYISGTEISALVNDQATSGSKVLTVQTPSAAGDSPFISNSLAILVLTPALNLTPTDVSFDRDSTTELTVSIPYTAPAGGVVANILSSQPTIATVPTTVVIPAGEMSQRFNVAGLNVGVANIAVNRTGFSGATSRVSVVTPPTLNFAVSTTSVVLSKSQDVVIESNRVAGSGGIVIALQSSNPAVARVPASVLIPVGQKSVVVHVEGLALGTATISTASNGFVASTLVVNVREQTISVLKALTNLAPTQSVSFDIVLSDPAPAGGLLVNLSTSIADRLNVPLTVTVPEGASSVAVTAQAQFPGNANLTLSATNFRTQIVPLSVDVVTLSLLPAGAINVVVGGQKKYAVNLSRALPFPVILSPSVSDGVAVLTPNSITIPAGQVTSGAVLTLEGRSPGTATLNLGAPTGFNASATSVSVGAALKLRFRDNLKKVPKGFRGAIGVVVLSNQDGSNYVATEPVVITLETSEQNKVAIPATIIIPRGASYAEFNISGVDTATPESPVLVNASAPGFLSPDQKLAIEVELPTFYFFDLDPVRLLNENRRDSILICVDGGFSNIIPVTLDVAVQSTVANIVDGLYSFQEPITQISIAGSCGTMDIGVARAVGSYRISASVFGKESLSNEVTVVAQPELEFVMSEYITATGMKGPPHVVVRRILNGSPYRAGSAISVTLAVADSAKAQMSQQLVTIPSGAAESSAVSLIGLSAGDTELVASAGGYTSGRPAKVKVGAPYLYIGLNNVLDQAVGDSLYAWAEVRVPGVDYSINAPSYLPAVDIEAALGFSNASPAGLVTGFYSSEDSLPIENLIFKADRTPISSFYVAPAVAAGSYRVTTKIGSADVTSSPLISVWLPELFLPEPLALPLKVLKGYRTSLAIQQRLNGQPYWRDAVISLVSDDQNKLQLPNEAYAESTFDLAGIESTNGGVVLVTATAENFKPLQFPVEVLGSSPVLLTSGLHLKRSLYSGANSFAVGSYLPGTILGDDGIPNSSPLCRNDDAEMTVRLVQANPANIVTLSSGNAGDCQQGYDIGNPKALGSYQISVSGPGLGTYVSPPVIVGQPELGLSFSKVENELDSLRLLPGFEATNDGYNYLVSVKNGGGGIPVPAGVSAYLTCEPSTLCQSPIPSVTVSSQSRRADFNFRSGQPGSGVIRIDAPGFGSGTVPIVVHPAALKVEYADPVYTPGSDQVWTLSPGRENWVELSPIVPGGLSPEYQGPDSGRDRRFSISVSDSAVISVPYTHRSPSWKNITSIRVDSLSSGTATLTISNPYYAPFSIPIVVKP